MALGVFRGYNLGRTGEETSMAEAQSELRYRVVGIRADGS
jgi:hypothetical protein